MTGIRVELQLKDGSFTTGMLRAGQSVSQFRSELARVDPHFRKMEAGGGRVITSVRKADIVSRDFLSTLRDISIVSGAVSLAFRGLTGASGGMIGSITQVNAEMERLRFQMLGMSTSAKPMQEAAASVDWLRQKALQVPFSLNEMASSFVKLKATGTDPMAGSLQAVVDGIAAFGGTDQHLHRVTLGITQMSGKGVIQMEEMRQQLGESMPNAMRIMARSMGVSVAELTKAISTGRVEAGAALQSFTEELTRTYGGEAQRMMETFSGQVSQLRANLQLLATGEGMKGFFEEQKAGLMEINDFLRSDEAAKFAKSIGEALTSMVRGIRVGVRALYEFREEIAQVIQVVAGGMAFKILGSAAMRLVTTLNFVKLGMSGIAGTVTRNTRIFSAGATAMMSYGASTRAAGLMAFGATRLVAGLGGALFAAAPWLAAIGVALSIAGQKMGWFSDKTNDAFENLKKFGAETKKQAEEVLGDKESDLLQDVADAERGVRLNFGKNRRYYQGLLDEANRKLAEFRREAQGILDKAEESETSQNIQEFEREIAQKLRTHNEGFRQRQVLLDRELDLELSRTAETGKKQFQITEDFQEKTLANRKQRSAEILATIDAEIASLQDLLKTQTDVDNRRETSRKIDFLRSKRVDEAENARNIDKFGISFVADIESEEDKIKRGVNLLDGLESKVKGLQAELAGAGNAYAKLQFEIARGDYGSIEDGGDAVRNLHNELREAVLQKEALDKLMRGDSQLESELERLESGARERRQRALEEREGRELSEAEKLLLKLNNGQFDGLGPLDNIKSDVEAVALSMRENAFGNSTVSQIKTVNETLAATLELITGIKNSTSGLEFGALSNLVSGGATMTPQMSGVMRSSAADILGLLAEQGVTGNAAAGIVGNFKVESAFNSGAVGDNGTSFGLAQWHKERWQELRQFATERNSSEADPRVQVQFLMHELEKKYPNLLARMNLAANPAEAASMFMREFERPDMSAKNKFGHEAARRQAAMEAAQIAPSGTPGMTATPFNSRAMVDNRVAATRSAEQRIQDAAAMDAETKRIEEENERAKVLRELIAAQSGASFETEGLGKNFAAMIEAIKSGDLGENRDIDSEVYKEILAAAKELDEIEARVNERRKATRQATEQAAELERERAEIARQITEEQARVENPDYVGQSNQLQQLNERLEKYVENVRIAFGADSAEYKAALQERTQLLAQQGILDATVRQSALSEELRDLRDGAMTQSELRRTELDRNIARIDAWLAAARQAGLDEVEIVRQAEEMKKQLRDEYSKQVNPVEAQMEQWQDFSGNIMQKTTGWMDSMADGLTGVAMGTTSLKDAAKSTIDSILSDVINAQVKFLTSSLMGDKASGAASKVGGKGKTFPSKHTGGIVGSGMRRGVRASPSAFIGAPKFHTGGIVGVPKLKSNEVPIIAKKKEGVFTEEQMAALAPVGSNMGQPITINAPVSVSGGGGTAEQNADLAKRMSREMELTMRGVVVEEIRRQSRPGNMLSGKK